MRVYFIILAGVFALMLSGALKRKENTTKNKISQHKNEDAQALADLSVVF